MSMEFYKSQIVQLNKMKAYIVTNWYQKTANYKSSDNFSDIWKFEQILRYTKKQYYIMKIQSN